MQTICDEKRASRKESLTRVGTLFLIAIVAMVVVGFQFMSAYKEDAPAIERTSLSGE
ncbi:MAG: hypothetical protein ACKVU1_10890 [bacterium]